MEVDGAERLHERRERDGLGRCRVVQRESVHALLRVLERRPLAPQRRVALLFGAALRRRVRGGGRLGGDARTTLVEVDDRRRGQRAQLQPAATHGEVAQRAEAVESSVGHLISGDGEVVEDHGEEQRRGLALRTRRVLRCRLAPRPRLRRVRAAAARRRRLRLVSRIQSQLQLEAAEFDAHSHVDVAARVLAARHRRAEERVLVLHARRRHRAGGDRLPRLLFELRGQGVVLLHHVGEQPANATDERVEALAAAGDAEALVVELLFLGLQQLAAPSDRVTREGRDKIVKRRRGGHPVRLGEDVEGSLVVVCEARALVKLSEALALGSGGRGAAGCGDESTVRGAAVTRWAGGRAGGRRGGEGATRTANVVLPLRRSGGRLLLLGSLARRRPREAADDDHVRRRVEGRPSLLHGDRAQRRRRAERLVDRDLL